MPVDLEAREYVYLTVVEGWLRDNRGIVFSEGSVDDLCDRIAAALAKAKPAAVSAGQGTES
jgi:hypothetical protein